MSIWKYPLGRLLRMVALALACAVLVVGCGRRTATVSGTVTSKGKKVKGGFVVFHGPGGRTSNGPITNGTYAVADVPVGDVRVSIGSLVDTMPGGMRPPKESLPMPGMARSDVPVKFRKADTSGLSYSVKPGSQQIDIQAD